MYNPRPIFEFLAAARDAGKGSALVTTLAVTGASARNPGAQMAVCSDGNYVGSFSGGCIEAAVVGEALDAIVAGRAREVRFGAGSPYIDIRLPCGGSIDLLFNPLGEAALFAHLLQEIRARRPVGIRLPRQGPGAVAVNAREDFSIAVGSDAVDLNYIPAVGVAIFGHGAAAEALDRSASAYGAEVEIYTPDEGIAARAAARGTRVHMLASSSSPPPLHLDRWTAAAFLFHDHDWEPALLAAALRQSAYYVGAMGNRSTHASRLERLRDLGVADTDLERIVSPVGIIPSSRDPETLALSVLAQLVVDYHRLFMSSAR